MNYFIKRALLKFLDLLRWCVKRWIKEDEKPPPQPQEEELFDDRWDDSGG